jgi:hypothetical protein
MGGFSKIFFEVQPELYGFGVAVYNPALDTDMGIHEVYLLIQIDLIIQKSKCT